MNKLPAYMTSITKLVLLLLVISLIALTFLHTQDFQSLFANVLTAVIGYYFGKTQPEPPTIEPPVDPPTTQA